MTKVPNVKILSEISFPFKLLKQVQGREGMDEEFGYRKAPAFLKFHKDINCQLAESEYTPLKSVKQVRKPIHLKAKR